MKTEDRKKLGKKTRKEGKDFEIRVRADLTEKGWIVCRFDNDVDFKQVEAHDKDNNPVECYFGKLVQAKTSWRRTPHGMFPMNLSPGFCDFVCFRKHEGFNVKFNQYEVIGVECKTNGTLDKLEKQKMKWLLDNHVFSRILISYKTKEKNRIRVNYKEFKNEQRS